MNARDVEVADRDKGSAQASCPTVPFGLRATSKIRDLHLDRLAMVYVRQSSPQQVLENRESRERQYALAQFANDWAGRRSVSKSSMRIKVRVARRPTIARVCFVRHHAHAEISQAGARRYTAMATWEGTWNAVASFCWGGCMETQHFLRSVPRRGESVHTRKHKPDSHFGCLRWVPR